MDLKSRLIFDGFIRNAQQLFKSKSNYESYYIISDLIIYHLLLYFDQYIPLWIQQKIHSTHIQDYADESVLTILSIRNLESHRREIYINSPRIHELLQTVKDTDYILAVECRNDINNEIIEHIFIANNENKTVQIVEWECGISFVDLPISKVLEYTFYNDGPWFLSIVGHEATISYKGSKFGWWKNALERPTDPTAFEHFLRIGLITKLHDKFAFRIPETEKSNWMIKDRHGKYRELPRPVHSLRVWSATKRCYEYIDAHLDGAPSDENAQKYWNDMLDRFRRERGPGYINGILETKYYNSPNCL